MSDEKPAKNEKPDEEHLAWATTSAPRCSTRYSLCTSSFGTTHRRKRMPPLVPRSWPRSNGNN
jgi:hypothetical protein